MKIIEHIERPQKLIDVCHDLWERSVRATHDFLTEEDIRRIKDYVPDAFRGVEIFATIEVDAKIKTESESKVGASRILGFMGIQGHTLEMLFLAPEACSRGLGRRLLEYGIEHHEMNELSVNEQNPQAIGFYEHMGFRTYKRTETDAAGDPYPILYMKRS